MFTSEQNQLEARGQGTPLIYSRKAITQDTELGREWWNVELQRPKENIQHKYKCVKVGSLAPTLVFLTAYDALHTGVIQ